MLCKKYIFVVLCDNGTLFDGAWRCFVVTITVPILAFPRAFIFSCHVVSGTLFDGVFFVVFLASWPKQARFLNGKFGAPRWRWFSICADLAVAAVTVSWWSSAVV
ncbi:MAG TPA: hypothetical protein PKZ47_09040 [Alistipes sp.]|uniref:hypothetical protein n=1 Tax=Alistipes sp. TaxID=1872444 RepID=UPI002C82C287|nr:hypothetical protein [Alistipes sp.]HUN15153.1 hypothetical protein [Alistipes sp.]